MWIGLRCRERKKFGFFVVYGRQLETNIIGRIKMIIRDAIDYDRKFRAILNSKMFQFVHSVSKNLGKIIFSLNNREVIV